MPWYDLLPGQLPAQVWRVAAYPFVGTWVTQAVFMSRFPSDPAFVVSTLHGVIGSLVAVLVDWLDHGRSPAGALVGCSRAGTRVSHRRLVLLLRVRETVVTRP